MAGRATDSCPFMMGFECLVDPKDDIALWVTIEIPKAMKLTNNDEELMESVAQQIQSYDANISAYAQHHYRYLCLSLPVGGFHRDENHNDAVIAQAKTLALWWPREIIARRVSSS